MESILVEDKPDVLALGCPTRKTLELLSSTWTVLVVHALAERTHRYSELKSRVEGVTHKMLAQTLRALERDGLVTRRVYPVVPPKVEYTLTPLGLTLVPILSSLCRWSEEHYDEVEAARALGKDGR
jgi:DNA-binding HxlR family transcriptional regulator